MSEYARVKMILYIFQVLLGVACYAFLHVRTGNDLVFVTAIETMAKTNEYFKRDFQKVLDSDNFKAAKSMAIFAEMLTQVSFCFWVVTFIKLITRFPRFAEGGPTGKRYSTGPVSRFNFEYMFHVAAMILYICPSSYLLVRLNISHLAKLMWNNTTAAVLGVVASILHLIFTLFVEKECRKRAEEVRHTITSPL